jgi:hypothetical protein
VLSKDRNELNHSQNNFACFVAASTIILVELGFELMAVNQTSTLPHEPHLQSSKF